MQLDMILQIKLVYEKKVIPVGLVAARESCDKVFLCGSISKVEGDLADNKSIIFR